MSSGNTTVYGRFKDLPWFKPITKKRILIFGQGGIGSWLTLLLARTGAQLITVDMDTVDVVNIAGQVYGQADVGKLKVEAMKSVVERLCGPTHLMAVNQKVSRESEAWQVYVKVADIVCVSFDSIAARKIVYEEWKKNGRKGSLFVDGRMGVENGQVFTLEKEAGEEYVQHYEDSFFDDESIEEAPCTMKATSHCGALIASLMTAQITNWLNNSTKALPRTVSAQLDFHLPVMLFEETTVKLKQEEDEESIMV